MATTRASVGAHQAPPTDLARLPDRRSTREQFAHHESIGSDPPARWLVLLSSREPTQPQPRAALVRVLPRGLVRDHVRNNLARTHSVARKSSSVSPKNCRASSGSAACIRSKYRPALSLGSWSIAST